VGDAVALYAVVGRDGKLRRNRDRRPMVYTLLSTAKAQCSEGDSVVEMYLNLDREPLYIRGRRVDE
jgi:hypothetical protein